MKAMRAILLGSFFAMLLLTACVHEDAYPASWGTIDPDTWGDRQCPDISGIYAEIGAVTALGCHTHQEKCPHLSYNLLGGGTSYAEVYDDDPTPAFSAGTTHVELRQQDDQTIEVILWQKGAEDGEPTIRGRVTTIGEGEYSCSKEGLHLQTRGIYFLWGISNLVGFENRTFNRTEDRDLVMKSEETIIAHHIIVPFGGSQTIWVRWQSTGHAPQRSDAPASLSAPFHAHLSTRGAFNDE